MAYITDKEIEELCRLFNSDYRRFNAACQLAVIRCNNPNATIQDLLDVRNGTYIHMDKLEKVAAFRLRSFVGSSPTVDTCDGKESKRKMGSAETLET